RSCLFLVLCALLLLLSSSHFLSPLSLFVFTATAPTELYTLSLHDALPIYYNALQTEFTLRPTQGTSFQATWAFDKLMDFPAPYLDRKSTRLNSSHEWISYAVFCLKKKNNKNKTVVIIHTTTSIGQLAQRHP